MQKTKNQGRVKYGSFVNTRIYELKSKHEDWYLFTFLSCSSETWSKGGVLTDARGGYTPVLTVVGEGFQQAVQTALHTVSRAVCWRDLQLL